MQRTAANAENVYADPSALLKLYLHERESLTMARWRAKLLGPLAVTLFGRVELVNGISLAAFRGLIPKAAHKAALAALEDDFNKGRCVLADLLWRAALKCADDISREQTVILGCRTLDVLHVASALTLEHRYFLTFDLRQRKLARAVGLKLITLE
jgi:hypothetical protein